MKRRLFGREKRKLFNRIISAVLVMIMLSSGMLTDVNARRMTVDYDGVSGNGTQEKSAAGPTYEDNVVTEAANELIYRAESGGTNIFDNTTITLNKLNLKATYQDDSGKSHIVELTQNGTFELPYNADINMRLDFMLGKPSAIEPGRPYTYQLPDGIRVDVEAVHDLADDEGKSIGKVHISRDGKLTFTFVDIPDSSVNINIPFYVQFEGGLSEENQEAGKHVDLTFPTSSGEFNFSIDTTGETGVDEKPEAGPVIMEKSGARVINQNGKNYIEWTVALGLNGREFITGTIHDDLPPGTSYAAIPGYPKVSGNAWGNYGYVETNAKDGDTSIDLIVDGCRPDYRTLVTFCTYYDESAFGHIDADTNQLINNKAYFEPADGTEWSEDEGSVTIRPDVLSKSGSAVDANGNIKWTVVINKEKLSLKNVTYSDIFGSGQSLQGDIKVTPALPSGSSLNTTANGFEIQFSGSRDDTSTYTLTYTTHVTDLAQQSFTNKGTLTGGDNVTYDVTKDAVVPGLTLLQKSCTDFNSINNTFTWQIVVNPANVEMNDVTVTDTFDSSLMEFVSASIEPASKTDGRLVFNLGNIKKRKVITVVTRVKNPESYDENNWTVFRNHSEMISSLNPTNPLPADAERWTQIKKPDLMDKSGQIKENGTAQWTVTVREPELTVEGITLTDILPAGMEYVPGSFWLQNMYYDPSPVYREPVIGTDPSGRQTITYTVSKTNAEESRFYKNAFQICYSTKVTDLDQANESNKYTNHAEISVDYEGGITVKDDDESTVEGVVGGVVDKTYDYKWGSRDVEWTVTINEARNDMSHIKNPKIYDDLASYFDYAGGKLYKVDASGKETEVLGNQYVVTVVNDRMIVQLPNIGSDCYRFKFTTRFNCLAAELEGKRITNKVIFKGDGESFEKESGSVDNVNFSSSSAGSVTRREIRVKKVDSVTKVPLEGARFELYLNGELIGKATSGENGYAVFESYNSLLGYELSLLETQAPDGYTILNNATTITDYDTAHLKKDEKGIEYYEIEIPNVNKNRQNTGDIHIKKTNAYGIVLPEAEFGLYGDAACTNLLETRITNESGTADFSGLTEGNYWLKELTPPPGYKLSNPNNPVAVVIGRDASDKIQITYDGVVKDVCEIENTSAVGKLRIKKVAKGGTAGLAGASFSIYNDMNCTDRVAYGTTDASGYVTLGDLELGRVYYYRETAAPGNYVLDNTIHSITVGKGTETEDQIKDITVENEAAKGNIVVTKTDDRMPAMPLSGVKFTLYDETGASPVSAPGLVNPVTTDSQGIAVFKNVPFGNYVIKETTGKTGYALSADRKITVNILGDVETTMVNRVIKCDVRIIKRDNTSHVPLSGAKIGLYTKSGRQVAVGVTNAAGEVVFHDIEMGDYDIKELEAPEGYKKVEILGSISSANIEAGFNSTGGVFSYTADNEKENGSIRLVKNGETDTGYAPLSGAVFTLYDKNMLPIAAATSKANGYTEFTGLRYGTYFIQETKVPDGYVRDTGIYKVIVDSDTLKTDYVTDAGEKPLIVNNRKSNAPYISVKLKKVDSETGKPVSDATFTLYASEGGKTEAIGTAVTGADGIAYFKRIHVEENDDNTIYTIKETSSPAGYYEPDAGLEIVLGSGRNEVNMYADPQIDGNPNLTDDQIMWVGGSTLTDKAIVKNVPIKGRILINKEAVSIEKEPLAGAQYTLYQEVNGKKEPVKIKGVANPVTTNAEGWAVFDDLPCGTYYVKETGAPKGYTLSEEETRFDIVDDSTQKITYKDTPIEVRVSKQALSGSAEIQGAAFKIVKKNAPDKVLDSWTSNDRYTHRVMPGVLEIGQTYILSEMIAPDGYGYMSDVEFSINSDGSITIHGAGEKNGQTIVVRDAPITMTISKQAADGAAGAELSNAIMAILDSQGKEIHRFTTNNIAPYQVPLGILSAPKTGYNVYTLREISAPDTYALAEDMEFSVGADGTVYSGTGSKRQPLVDAPLVMVDEKKVPFYFRKLDGNTRLDVPGARFDIIEVTSGDSILFQPIVTNGRPITLDQFAPGEEYIIRELDAPDGYQVAREIRIRVFENPATGTLDVEIIDGRPNNLNVDRDTIMIYDAPIELRIRKQDSFGTILKGATLKLSKYNKDRQTVGEEVITFVSDGIKSYTVLPSDLECNADYILQEIDAPDGYKRADDIVLHISDNGAITREDGVPVFNNTIVMEDDEAGLGIGKFSLDDGDGLAGCTLKLETVDDPWWKTTTWVSDGHVRTWDLTDFTPGCTYILTEVEAPVGYAYTDPITFTIDADDHQVYIDGQKVDNRTVRISDGKIKLTVSKQDFYDHVEVPGAELSILNAQGEVVASWVSGTEACEVDTSRMIAGNGTYEEYTLREVTAPNGYYKTVDIAFAIDRDGKIYLVKESGSGQKQYEPVEGNRLTMYDEPMLTIAKLDTSGNPVVGAKLTITAKDDPNFTPISWETTAERRAFEDGTFAPGATYILTEDEAPNGYGYAQSLEFMVTADNKVYVNGQLVENRRIVMLDYPIKVLISKLDGGNRQGLAGAKLAIKNEAGEVIHTFTSTGEPVLLPIEIFKAVPGGLSYYTLSEIEAPGGYQIAPDIAFAIDSTGKLLQRNGDGTYVPVENDTLIMLDYSGESGYQTNINTNVPRTGDETPLKMLIAFCIVGFMGACAAFGWYFIRRRKKTEQ